jgi:hypothetical protein
MIPATTHPSKKAYEVGAATIAPELKNTLGK